MTRLIDVSQISNYRNHTKSDMMLFCEKINEELDEQNFDNCTVEILNKTYFFTVMKLCEQNRLVLRQGVAYIFEEDPECVECKELADVYR